MRKFCLLLLLFLAMPALAVKNLAVLEIIPNTSVLEQITIEESRHLSDELRKQAVSTLPSNTHTVLTRDNILALMPPDEEEADCLAEGCAVSIGRAIGVEYISSGTVGQFAGELTLSVELYETMGGKLLGSIVMESKDTKGLLIAIRNESGELFKKILAFEGYTPPPPPLHRLA